jgi:hypothetical protein
LKFNIIVREHGFERDNMKHFVHGVICAHDANVSDNTGCKIQILPWAAEVMSMINHTNPVLLVHWDFNVVWVRPGTENVSKKMPPWQQEHSCHIWSSLGGQYPCWLTDCNWVWDLMALMHLGLNWHPICAPYQFKGGLVTLPEFQMTSSLTLLTLWHRNFLLNFCTPCIKMWIIQELNKVALRNKRHFEEKNTEITQHV